ncbi:phosphatases II [Xylariaceae sp. FL0662B]|nr:phosphatases II [Xylariaceae sp. FL0662B]
MDHLSSRFRRTKKASSASPVVASTMTPPDSKQGPPTSQSTHTSHGSSPVLSIITTPPSSSHSSNSNTLPPKSPFRGFHFRHSNKRARSPTPAALPAPTSPAVVNHNGKVEHDTMPPAKEPVRNGGEINRESPKIPAFLSLSEQEIDMKFQEIGWEERIRLYQSTQNPSPNHRFARVALPEAKLLDRYANIQPWENNRVKLRVPPGQVDYINASPITLYSPLKPNGRPPHRYIAMQGPKFGTTDHVWRMITEQLQSPAVIVMLTETHEMGMEKCYPYFPRATDEEPLEIGEDDPFGDGFRAQVTCTSVEEMAEGAIEVRKMNVHVEGREDDMTVWHLLYRRWPDFGVPALEDIDSFFELMHLSRERNASEDNPRIIHCSAGVGRSGTFIALEHLMREVDSGDLEHYDEQDDKDGDIVYDTVNALREQRKQMVQSESQYLFIYQVLRKMWMEKYGIEDEIREEPAAKRLEVDHDPFIED